MTLGGLRDSELLPPPAPVGWKQIARAFCPDRSSSSRNFVLKNSFAPHFNRSIDREWRVEFRNRKQSTRIYVLFGGISSISNAKQASHSEPKSTFGSILPVI